jgi:hypothetical protein
MLSTPGLADVIAMNPPPATLAPEDSSTQLGELDADAGHEINEVTAGLRYPQLDPQEQEAKRAELQDRLAAYLPKGRPRVVLTDNTHTMLSVKRGKGVLTYRMHHMFVDAPSVVLRALARYGLKQDRDASDLLKRYIDANEAQIRRRLHPRPVAIDVEGRHHNLQELFDDINRRYFDGSIRARITWGPRAKRKRRRHSVRLGSYTVEDELIRIHPVLDASDVPPWFVAWVIYHEMLHEVHDMPIVDGRRIYHTREFREAEAQFERYTECVLWERTNLDKLLAR